MPETTTTPPYDRAKVEHVLRAEPLGTGRLYDYDTGQYCALGALCHAAGWSARKLWYVPVSAYEEELGPALEREYGLPRWMIRNITYWNDQAPAGSRAADVLDMIDRYATAYGFAAEEVDDAS